MIPEVPNNTMTIVRSELTEPMRILVECLELMMKKASDYQGSETSVRQAMYYPHGIDTIMDLIETKKLRLVSLLEQKKRGHEGHFESIEDTLKDMANYAAIGAAWVRGKIDGQVKEKDIFNLPAYPRGAGEVQAFSPVKTRFSSRERED